jgi:hypothetical protein
MVRTPGTCTVEFFEGRFVLSILNSQGWLVSKMTFDHHAEREMSQFIKFWLEHRELRPIHIGVSEVEFHPEHVEEGYYVAGSPNRPPQTT